MASPLRLTFALSAVLAIPAVLVSGVLLGFTVAPRVDGSGTVLPIQLFAVAVFALTAGYLVVQEVGARRRSAVREALAEERRRIARDLHDHLAQELAFISMQAHMLAEKDGDEEVGQIAVAAVRALRESRRMIIGLRRAARQDEPCTAAARDSSGASVPTPGAPAKPLHISVGRVAEELAARTGAKLTLNLDPRAELASEARQDLLGILREAVWNGLRHGKADAINVELLCKDGLRLRVVDNGAGFDLDELRRRPRGFGLLGMFERAREGGGNLRLQSRPGVGTLLEVTLPSTGQSAY